MAEPVDDPQAQRMGERLQELDALVHRNSVRTAASASGASSAMWWPESIAGAGHRPVDPRAPDLDRVSVELLEVVLDRPRDTASGTGRERPAARSAASSKRSTCTPARYSATIARTTSGFVTARSQSA